MGGEHPATSTALKRMLPTIHGLVRVCTVSCGIDRVSQGKTTTAHRSVPFDCSRTARRDDYEYPAPAVSPVCRCGYRRDNLYCCLEDARCYRLTRADLSSNPIRYCCISRCTPYGGYRTRCDPDCHGATGSYWITLALILRQLGYAISIINPERAHHFALALAIRAKTDPIDAQRLADLAARATPTLDAAASHLYGTSAAPRPA